MLNAPNLLPRLLAPICSFKRETEIIVTVKYPADIELAPRSALAPHCAVVSLSLGSTSSRIDSPAFVKNKKKNLPRVSHVERSCRETSGDSRGTWLRVVDSRMNRGTIPRTTRSRISARKCRSRDALSSSDVAGAGSASRRDIIIKWRTIGTWADQSRPTIDSGTDLF